MKLLRKSNTLKDKLIASFRNLKPYSPSFQNLGKQGTRLLSHLIGGKNININKIRVETQPTAFARISQI